MRGADPLPGLAFHIGLTRRGATGRRDSSASLYRTGPTGKVPGGRGMTWEEEDWVDADATAHRDADE